MYGCRKYCFTYLSSFKTNIIYFVLVKKCSKILYLEFNYLPVVKKMCKSTQKSDRKSTEKNKQEWPFMT